jgi:origin recognition complex subunit 2
VRAGFETRGERAYRVEVTCDSERQLAQSVTMPKRQHDGEKGGNTPTPKKLRRTALEDEVVPSPAETPSKRKSILRGTPVKANGTTRDAAPTPTPLKKVLFSTPKKTHPEDDEGYETPTAARNDRSARRKSASALQGTFVDNSDVEEDTTDARIAAEILDSEDEEGDESAEETIGVSNAPKAPDTPSKTGKPRGRPKGKRRDRTPTPPPDLPPHETYFFQNRAGGNKTSTNALPSHLLLDHDDYRTHIQVFNDPHESDIRRLKQLHHRGFDQWTFELEQGFNLCLYGYGSKRNLAMSFAEHIYQHAEKTPKILIINGYTPGLTIRDVLTTVASQMLPKTIKLPAQPTAMLDLIFESLTERPSTRLTLIIHSIDHPNLRKSQPLLARLASNPSISLLATCDTPNFALLWDISLTRQFRFLYHDATTFEPYTAELDVVEEVNILLGRSGRRLGGKDGVGYVLKSLPENARNLFRILVAEQLALADVEGGAGGDSAATAAFSDIDIDSDDVLGASDEEAALQQDASPTRRVRGKGRPAKKAKAKKAAPKPIASSAAVEGVEYRTLYHKAVEEFVCSSEVNFRTLLKEFHDHQMVESRKDAMGTERLSVPFRKEELEGMLEDLV